MMTRTLLASILALTITASALDETNLFRLR